MLNSTKRRVLSALTQSWPITFLLGFMTGATTLWGALKLLGRIVPAALALSIMIGCDGSTIPSPYSGKDVTAPTLMGEVQKAEADARQKAAEEEKADKREAQRIASKAAAESIAATAKLDITAAEVKAKLAEIQAETGISMQAIAERADARQKELAATLKTIGEQADTAFAAIQAKDAQRNALVSWATNNPFVKSAAASVGIDTGGLGGILASGAGTAMIATWFGRRSREAALADGKAQRDALRDDHADEVRSLRDQLARLQEQHKAELNQTWDEATAAAHAARDKADAAHDAAQAHTLALLSPPPMRLAAPFIPTIQNPVPAKPAA